MVFRVQKNKNYTTICNYHLKDKNLSFKAKGLLSIMLSLPDNWDYSINGIIAISKENETSVKSTLKELKQYGYLEVIKLLPNQTKSGRIEYQYNIYEIPKQESEKQGVEILVVEFLEVENQGQLNTNKLSTKELSTEDIYSTTTTREKKQDDIFTYLEKTFGRPLGSAEYELASKWEDNDLTRYAIKQAELARVFNVKYIDKILYSYKKDNITTIEEAEKRNEEYQESKNKKTNYEYKSAFERKWEDQRRAEEIFLRGE